MKKSGLMLWLLILTGSAWAQEPEKKPPPDITAYLHPSNPHKGMSETVHQMLTEAGKTLGFRGGKAQRAWELQGALRDKENILNTLYDFRTLISPKGGCPGGRLGSRHRSYHRRSHPLCQPHLPYPVSRTICQPSAQLASVSDGRLKHNHHGAA